MAGDSSPFSIDGDDRGVLCLHGFTGTPYEMRYLGRVLGQRGMTVRCPLLPGHGTDPRDLARTHRDDWRKAVDSALDELRSCTRAVAVVGESMGGLLALDVAARRKTEISAVATLAAPLWFTGLAAKVAKLVEADHWLVSRLSALPKLGGSDVRDQGAKANNPSYDRIPLPGFRQLLALMGEVDRALSSISHPSLVIHARDDHTAPFACASHIMRNLASTQVDSLMLAESFHLIAIDVERALVAKTVGDFVDFRLAQ